MNKFTKRIIFAIAGFALSIGAITALNSKVHIDSKEAIVAKAAQTYQWAPANEEQEKFEDLSGVVTLGDPSISWNYTIESANYFKGFSNNLIQLGSKNNPAGAVTMKAYLPASFGDAISSISVDTYSYQGSSKFSIKVGGNLLKEETTGDAVDTITTGILAEPVQGEIELSWTAGTRAKYLGAITIVGADLNLPEFGNLQTLEVSKPAEKLQFEVSETFTSEGLELKAGDDSDPVVHKIIHTGYSTSLDGLVFDSTHLGSQNVTVTYETKTTNYSINVVPKSMIKALELNITSKNKLSAVGEKPNELSSETLVETYGTSKQMTRGNSQTLTLKNYNNIRITSITLSMRSNSSSGAGNFKYSLDNSATFTEIVATNPFNNANWYGSWSASYVDVTKNVDILVNDDITFVLSATANSIYCESYSFTYELLPEEDGNRVAARSLSDFIMSKEGGDVVTADCENNWTEAFMMYDDLTAEAKELFKTDAEFADAFARYQNWAIANNSTIDGEDIKPSTKVTPSKSNNIAAVTTIGIIGLTSIAAYYFIGKKKQA